MRMLRIIAALAALALVGTMASSAFAGDEQQYIGHWLRPGDRDVGAMDVDISAIDPDGTIHAQTIVRFRGQEQHGGLALRIREDGALIVTRFDGNWAEVRRKGDILEGTYHVLKTGDGAAVNREMDVTFVKR